ncbi:MAG: ATP-dependent DNA helicase, partial [Actinomycetia bacterium]|nr:ATP-dependent DNA helicase [Actinomycetes bacterium]
KGKGILKDISLNRETKKNIESAHNKAALSINALLEVLSEFYQKRVSGSKGDFPEKLIIKNSQNKGEIKKLKEKAVEKLADYITLIENTKVFAKDSEDEMIFNAVKERLSELKNNITDFIEMKSDNFVYWMTKREKRLFTDVVCTATPVMVNRFLEKYLYDFISRIILTSATLTVQRKFSYMQERLGLKDSAALMLESPFKMKERVIEYYPELPFPGDTVNFRKKITGEITRLVNLTSGNTFVLFTSYSMMNFVHSKIENKIDLKILKQGKISRNKMVSQFKKGGTVLFGTTTFWQGIDIPGDSLKQVIIVKLPFPVPTEPIIKARDELYKKEGRNFFMEYMVPETAIMVKQGYGRLIRNENDYGIISILDSRCIDKFYGKFIVSSLPGSKTRNFNDLKVFLQRFEKTI